MTTDKDIPITVRRDVLAAAKKLEDKNLTDDRGLTDWHLAQEQRDFFRQQGDNDKADFYHEVYHYLMHLEVSSADTEIIVTDNPCSD